MLDVVYVKLYEILCGIYPRFFLIDMFVPIKFELKFLLRVMFIRL